MWQGGVARLVEQRLRESREIRRDPLVIPNDPSWKQVNAGTRDYSDSKMRYGPGVEPTRLYRVVDFSAQEYNVCRVRMRVDAGSRCELAWESNVEPLLHRNPGVSAALVADGASHLYEFRLGGFRAANWVGHITRVRLIPSNRPANVEVERVEFSYDPPEGPVRVTIAGETHEALFGTQDPWRVVVPSGSVFEAYVGMPELAWDDNKAGSARFTVGVDAEIGPIEGLAEVAVDPKDLEQDRVWKRVTVDLAAFAGKEIGLRLEVDALGYDSGDYAYWGSPMVYSIDEEEVKEAGSERSAEAMGKENVPVILISCDTTRADHFSCYGYERKTTPYLDEWAAEAVLFENAIVEETWTLPSHVTMLTGMHPNDHGVTPYAVLAERVTTIPEAMREVGYVTAGFTGSALWFLPWRGIGHGFDYYDTPEAIRSVFETHQRLEAWLDTHPFSRLFLFVHNMDMHSRPEGRSTGLLYGPEDSAFLHFSKELDPPPVLGRNADGLSEAWAFISAVNEGRATISKEQRDYLVALYDDSIRSVDLGIHQLFEDLKRRGLYDQAFIIVTADHGEDLCDHGQFGHWSVYEECCRVPLLMKFPHGRFGGTRYAGLVQLADLAPTILDVTGLTVECLNGQNLSGASLVPRLEGPNAVGRAYAYVQRYTTEAVRSEEWKLLRDRRFDGYRLFNLLAEPKETTETALDGATVFASMRESLEQFYRQADSGWHIRYEAPDDGKKRTLTLRTDDRFEMANLLYGDRNNDYATMRRDSRILTVDWAGGVGDTLAFRTVSPSARVWLSVESETEFTIALGGEPPRTVERRSAPSGARAGLDLALDPNERAYPRPESPKEGDPREARLQVWHIAPEAEGAAGKGEAAKELSTEELGQMKALGYLGD